MLLGKDGVIYGTTGEGGAKFYGSIFKLSPTGHPTTIYSFTGGSDVAVPNPASAQDHAGNFYGTTDSSGDNNNGTVFKVSLTGVFTLLHAFTNQESFIYRNGIVRGSDGNFYGVTGNGTPYQVTTAGDYTPLTNLGYTLVSGLTSGKDGNLYGLGKKTGTFVTAVVQISTAGLAQSFGTVPVQDTDITTLIQGSDGNSYGTVNGYGYNRDGGAVFRVAADGTYTLLHQFDDPYEGIITSNSQLLEGSDGNFYGAASEGDTAPEGKREQQDILYQITPGGAFTVLYTFSGKDGSFPQVSGDVNPVAGAALLAGPNSSFYGTTAEGGADNYGTIFQATLHSSLQPVQHPSFFAGEATLANGVYYLSFSNGNYFGYYSFLSDPRYLYHFDLSYEYVFDAQDGKSGVYLYDFASQTFFYTSPTFPFPYLYDFTLNTVLYYYPDPDNAGHYNTDGTRYFYNFAIGQIITK